MTPAERYLRLSSAYCDVLGGLRWSSQDDALEYQDGATFAFTDEVALFLEGFASGGRLIHFAFVLHLLHILHNAGKAFAPGRRRLSDAYAETGWLVPNAGAFCAVLCRDLPAASGAPDARDVLDRLRSPERPIRWFVGLFRDTFSPSELPPLFPAEFEEEIARQLEAYSAEELIAWLRHGRGPVKQAGKALARELPPPRTLDGVLTALLERPRLAGARHFVQQMVSVLAMLPQRRIEQALPLGGYADVTTKGEPANLLPSQFALDEWDFLRRHADNELLYFRREEPHVRTRHQLVVLLDQGVRTWGDVRQVLAAAVLALGRLAARHELQFFLSTTSEEGGMIDPLELEDDDALGQIVEASDLTANPGLALERLLERPAECARDIVLLTHPRNLKEEDVRVAALRADRQTRLLALSLDGEGQAAVSELRHGAPIPIRQFRVDFNASSVPPTRAQEEGAPPAAWQGDLEPIGWPFRFGTNNAVGADLFDFDHDGRWLITATGDVHFLTTLQLTSSFRLR